MHLNASHTSKPYHQTKEGKIMGWNGKKEDFEFYKYPTWSFF